MNRGVSYHSVFSDLFSACFKLRLYQAYHLSVIFKQIPCGRKYLIKRDKGYVHACKIKLIIDIPGLHEAEVGLLHNNHSLIVSELPGKLSVSHVDGVNLFRTVLEHAVGKAAC